MSDRLWFVAHTRPRCEKKLVHYCEQDFIPTTLPLYRTVHHYRGKKASFLKPLFPGYVFVQMIPSLRQKVYQSQYVANLLDVFDQDLFNRQLRDIMQALETKLEIRQAPHIGEGIRVRIKAGPLEGLEGWTEKRYGPNIVLLRLDFIAQAAAIRIEAGDLEPV